MDIFDIASDELPELLNQFLGYLYTIKAKSPNTIEGYKTDLKMFLKFIKKSKLKLKEEVMEVPIDDIDESLFKNIRLIDLYSFINYITSSRDNSSYARARKTAAIKSFFNYLETKAKIINENPARELESPKIEKRHPVYLTLEESKILLASINGRNKERDYAIITLFLNCGLRLSELININISKIKDDTLTVIGKGNKERTVYLSPSCIKAVNSYLQVRPRDDVDDIDKDALFLSERKRRINKRTVELLVEKYIKNSSIIGKKYTPHKLRHTAATLMYKYGNVDIRALQQILGHESVSTTQIYTHLDDEKLRKAVLSNPLSEIEE